MPACASEEHGGHRVPDLPLPLTRGDGPSASRATTSRRLQDEDAQAESMDDLPRAQPKAPDLDTAREKDAVPRPSRDGPLARASTSTLNASTSTLDRRIAASTSTDEGRPSRDGGWTTPTVSRSPASAPCRRSSQDAHSFRATRRRRGDAWDRAAASDEFRRTAASSRSRCSRATIDGPISGRSAERSCGPRDRRRRGLRQGRTTRLRAARRTTQPCGVEASASAAASRPVVQDARRRSRGRASSAPFGR